MSYRYITLIFILPAILVLFFVFKNQQQHNYQTAKKMLTPTIYIPNQPDPTTLSFSPSSLYAENGKSYEISFLLSANQVPNFTQLELGFDPTVISFASINANTELKNSRTKLNLSNQRSGRISFVSTQSQSNQSSPPNQILLATLNISISENNISSQSAVSILPKTTIKTHHINLTPSTLPILNIIIKTPIQLSNPI